MTAADQLPAEWRAVAKRALQDLTLTQVIANGGIDGVVLAAVWPLVLRMVRDARVETLDEVATRFGDVKYPDVWSVLAELRREVLS